MPKVDPVSTSKNNIFENFFGFYYHSAKMVRENAYTTFHIYKAIVVLIHVSSENWGLQFPGCPRNKNHISMLFKV